MVCWFVLSLVAQAECRVGESPGHLGPCHRLMGHSAHSCSGRCYGGRGCRRYHVGQDHSRQEKSPRENEDQVHLHVASVGLVVIEESVEVEAVEREVAAGRDCVVDDVEGEAVDDSQTATCLSCRAMCDMGVWHKKREVIVQPSATAAVVTPIEVSFQLVASLASVGFATGYCVMGKKVYMSVLKV